MRIARRRLDKSGESLWRDLTRQELWMHRKEEIVQKDKSEKILEDYNDGTF